MLFSGEKLPIQLVSVSVNPASINATTSAETDVTVEGVRVGDYVQADVPASLEVGLVFSGIRVKADNTVSVRLSNITSSPVDGAARTWIIAIVRSCCSFSA